MNFTILEAEHKSGIPSRKIRFWLDKGLFHAFIRTKTAHGFLIQKILIGSVGLTFIVSLE